MNQSKETELILALDCEDKSKAIEIISSLKQDLKWVKIGLQMFTAYGKDFVKEIKSNGYNVFLDLKLHDIPNTVAKAIDSLSDLSIDLLTIHASGGAEMCEYAARARNETNPNLRLLAVTVLTSINQAQLNQLNIKESIQKQVVDLAKLSTQSGVDGVVSSPLELGILRSSLDSSKLIVTPGIRPLDSEQNEQKRVMTPEEASEKGADFIVVGRPILNSPEPTKTVKQILQSIS
ncbi:MAG: orotidine-5'-phosphate decarboxylase [Puniceicoccaceae bacterium TMED149]|nr:MAG: orotidine-5'-phosphate decarboxylase [Puniceicoccaceae bacterium TMED149]|tara:strand:+ start:2056 stop:2757 length:702 start_codon:yes stop_codon:yes gene_type:complete